MDLFAKHIDKYDHLEETGEWEGGCLFCDAAIPKIERTGGGRECFVCPLGDGVDDEEPCKEHNSYLPSSNWHYGAGFAYHREEAPKSWVRKRRAQLIKVLDEFWITIK